jgi:hypothetical protein
MDAAHAMAMFESARRLGLIEGGPDVSLERCADVLNRAKKLDLTADPLGVHALLNEMAGPQEAHRVMLFIDQNEGALAASGLLGTPLMDYAFSDIYRGGEEG